MPFQFIAGIGLPLPAVAEEKMLTPPAAVPFDDESTGDLTPDDLTDCADEGTGQPATTEADDDRRPQLTALVKRVLRAEAAALALSLRIEELEHRIEELQGRMAA